MSDLDRDMRGGRIRRLGKPEDLDDAVRLRDLREGFQKFPGLVTAGPAFISGGGGGRGERGPQGPAGTGGGGVGVQGPQGNQGNQGLQGPSAGGQGPQGPQGNQGFQGDGVQGFQGPQGNQGNQGPTPETCATVTTTDNTDTTIATIPIPDDTVVFIHGEFVGRRTNAADRAGFVREALVFREGGGGATLQGAVGTPFSRDSNAYNATITVSGNDALLVVQGDAGHNVNWRVCYHTVQVS